MPLVPPSNSLPCQAPPEIIVQDLYKSFGEHRVLSGVNLILTRGELVAIVGGSGCGKTVLLKLITGHLLPDSGRILVADHESPGAPLRDLAAMSDDEMDRLRVHWAVVFQRNALLSGTVYDNLALWPTEIKRLTEAQILPLARRALTDVGLTDDIMQSPRDALSGGMAKRLAIARAIVMDPVLIFYDEPTAGLDPEMGAHIHRLIAQTHSVTPALWREHVEPGEPDGAQPLDASRRTSVIITHDTELLRTLRPRVVMLHGGTVLFDGSFEQFMESANPHILPYLRQMPTLQAVKRDAE